MASYLKAAGRGFVVIVASLGWLLVVPFVDLLSRESDRLADDRAQRPAVRLTHAEAA